MAHRLSRNASINRNTATYASPTWSAVQRVRDATLNESSVEADASTRESSYSMTVPVRKEASFDFEIIEDTTDANWIAINAAYRNHTALDLAILNAAVTTSGAHGIRGYFSVTNFNRAEALDGIIMRNVTVKPTLPSDGNYIVEMTV